MLGTRVGGSLRPGGDHSSLAEIDTQRNCWPPERHLRVLDANEIASFVNFVSFS